MGKEVGAETPANSYVTQELMRIISAKIPWEKYRKKPAEIVSNYHQFKKKYLSGNH